MKNKETTRTKLFHDQLLRIWMHQGFGAMLLWPLSLLYRVVVGLRRRFYQWGWYKTQRVDALVVVVGNVIAGGAGKTPTAIALAAHLRAQGYSVGLVSRGYGRSGNACLEVTSESLPQEVGDEPLLLRRATGAPVFVARSRHEAATALLARYPQTHIILCDDGLQHYGLYRDLEICVFDARGCGNGLLLPAGPLRQSWPRRLVARVGQHPQGFLVLHTGQTPAFAGFCARRALADYAVRCDGTQLALTSLLRTDAQPLLAVAAIAQPEAFFAMLRALGLPLAKTLALPDHYDFDSFSRSFHGGYTLICTEKDAAKLWQRVPDALAVPLILHIEPAFFSALDACVDGCVAERRAARLSLPHGHQTS